jgi:putative spermidine/putrescine transport system ATP-binding protein
MTASQTSAPVLELAGVQKNFGNHAAVRGVDLRIEKEEFLTFLGPSGSGKTTTLMMIAGLEQPDAGDIILAGRPIARLPAYDRDIGMVFQHYALFPHMSVKRNVAFPLQMRGVKAAEIARRVANILHLVGLDGLEQRLPRQLSGGQQQRVALARALVYNPSLLLMDEPLGALDKKLRDQLQREIKRLHRDQRITILYVTHDQEEALTMSDRIAVFNRGSIEQIGTAAELYERPATRFVAEFIGEMNFLPANIVDHTEGETCLDVAGASMTAARRHNFVAGDRVVAAVRPERLTLSDSGPGLSGHVVDAIFLGNATRYIVRLQDGTDCSVLQAVGAVAEAGSLEPGQNVTLAWDKRHVMLFAAS